MPPAKRIDAGAIAIAALLMLVAVGALWESSEFSAMGAIFPRTIGAALLVGSAISLWRSLRGRAPTSRGIPRDGFLRGLLLVVVMAIWIAVLERVGFAVAGVAGFVALAAITEREPLTLLRLVRYLVVAAVVVIAFQLLFVQVLKVQLPAGALFA